MCLPQSVIPNKIAQKYGLGSLSQAYLDIHNPPSAAAKDAAAARIALEEYFVLISAFKYIKGGKDDARTRRYACTAEEVKGFAARFPFEFTEGQKRAVNDVYENLKSPTRMNRLLQGDVGSGKTAVALCALFMAVKSGYQAAFIAPTEVLAEQNFRLICNTFPEYECVFLSGATSAKEKKERKAAATPKAAPAKRSKPSVKKTDQSE